MNIGDTVVRKSYGRDVTFKIIDQKMSSGNVIYILKGINMRIIADAPLSDLEVVDRGNIGKMDLIFNKRVNNSIKKILQVRDGENLHRKTKKEKLKDEKKIKELAFGRPGRILHVDGDSDYLNVCLKVYKQLSLEAVGRVIPEEQQANLIVQIVKETNPDIVVITGHDSMIKGNPDYLNLDNYKNSKYFVEAVSKLRSYRSNYDDLVIVAGACQSCYEAILDAGANYASSPGRVLIHCLDPVFVCEKIAYTNIDKVVSIYDVIDNTITGINGIGGLQTRGKYREGFPKSTYA